MTREPERTLEIDGLRHRWLDTGEGPAVVLVHGIPTSPARWRHVVPQLTGARLLAWEMIGYGLSRRKKIATPWQTGEIGPADQTSGLERLGQRIDG